MRDQRLREVKERAQGHTVNKWYKGNFSPSLPDAKGPAGTYSSIRSLLSNMRAPRGVGRRRLPALCSLPFRYELPTVKSRCQVYGLEPEVHFNSHLCCGESWTCSYPRSSFPAPWNALSHRYQCPLATIPVSQAFIFKVKSHSSFKPLWSISKYLPSPYISQKLQ